MDGFGLCSDSREQELCKVWIGDEGKARNKGNI